MKQKPAEQRTEQNESLRIFEQKMAMSADERKLWDKMQEYDEKYFADMRFETKYLERKFARMEILDDDGNWKDILTDPPMKEDSFFVADWSIKLVDNINDYAVGRCNREDMIIEILTDVKGFREQKYVLLHELIHVYEYLYERNRGYKGYEQYLVLHLYKRLEKKIGKNKFNSLIDTGLNFELIRDCLHSLLFLFKSLELDLKLKKPFGTIYGYGREDYFR